MHSSVEKVTFIATYNKTQFSLRILQTTNTQGETPLILEYKVQKKLQVVYRHTVNKDYKLATKRETKIYRQLLLEEEGGNATTTYTTSTNRTSGVIDAATRNGIERLRIVKNCQ